MPIHKTMKYLTVLVLTTCSLLWLSIADAQFSVSERTYKKLTKAEKMIQQGNHKDALELLQDLETAAKNRKYEKTLIYLAQAYLYIETNKPNNSIDYFEKSLALNSAPEDMLQNIRLNLVKSYASENKYQKAVQHFEQWVKKEMSPSGEILALGGSLYAQVKQYDAAIRYLLRAIDSTKQPDESWYRTLLSIYFDRKDYASATKLLKTLVVKHPDSKQYWQQLFSVYLIQEKHKKALATLEVAYKAGIMTDESDILNLARLYISLNTPIRAANLIEHEFSSNRLSNNKNSLRLLADAYLQGSEPFKAGKTYLQIAKIENNPDLYLQATQLFFDARQWESVVKAANAATDSLNNPELQVLKGMALIELDKIKDATEAFQIARDNNVTRENAEQWLDYIGSL